MTSAPVGGAALPLDDCALGLLPAVLMFGARQHRDRRLRHASSYYLSPPGQLFDLAPEQLVRFMDPRDRRHFGRIDGRHAAQARKPARWKPNAPRAWRPKPPAENRRRCAPRSMRSIMALCCSTAICAPRSSMVPSGVCGTSGRSRRTTSALSRTAASRARHRRLRGAGGRA